MDPSLLIQSIITVVIAVGLPVLILLALAVQIGRWHEAQPEVPDQVFREGHDLD